MKFARLIGYQLPVGTVIRGEREERGIQGLHVVETEICSPAAKESFLAGGVGASCGFESFVAWLESLPISLLLRQFSSQAKSVSGQEASSSSSLLFPLHFAISRKYKDKKNSLDLHPSIPLRALFPPQLPRNNTNNTFPSPDLVGHIALFFSLFFFFTLQFEEMPARATTEMALTMALWGPVLGFVVDRFDVCVCRPGMV